LSEQWRLVFIPALSDTTISDQIIDILKRKYPDIELVKKKEQTEKQDCVILPRDADTEQLIDVLELVGAACVFYGTTSDHKYGWSCWYKATTLREGNAIPKTTLPQCKWEKIAFEATEFKSTADLKKLFCRREIVFKDQAFLASLRISKICSCHPHIFVVYNLYNFAVRDWIGTRLTRKKVFATSLCLFDLFGTTKEFFDQLVQNPADSLDVVHLTFTQFFSVLKIMGYSPTNLPQPGSLLLTFENMMSCLEFSFAYTVKVHDLSPTNSLVMNPELTIKSKADKLEEISNLIIFFLKLLVAIPKSKTQSKQLKNRLAVFINIYELKRACKKPNILLKVCSSHQGTPNEFKLIKLLLKAGADPNAVDQQRCSPLHLLANTELSCSHTWGNPYYSTRAENFTSIVRVIFDGRFHADQVNLSGQSALECLIPLSSYPDEQLSRLVGNFSQGVRPLSCIAAKEVRRNQLPCECLPLTLQSLVLQH
jgi:hypothetical protein